MRLLADVHVRPAYLAALCGDGHDVSRVVDVLDETASDAAIVEHASETERVGITNDVTDFSQFTDHPGVLVVPQTGVTAGEVAASVLRIERFVYRVTLSVSEWLSGLSVTGALDPSCSPERQKLL